MIADHARESSRQADRIMAEFGPDSPEADAASFFSHLAEPLTAIAASLLERGNQPAVPWRQVDPHAAENIEKTVKDPTQNDPLRVEKLLLQRLLDTTLPSEAERLNEQFARVAFEKNLAGKPAILMVLDDSFVSPDRKVGEGLFSFIPSAQLIFPLPAGEKSQDPAGRLWPKIADLHGGISPEPPHILGYAVMTAGTDVLSPTIGQGLAGGGFELAVNLLARRQESLDAAARLLNHGSDTLSPQALIRFMTAHEQSHAFDETFPGEFARSLAELRCDTAAALAVLTDNQDSATELVAIIADLCVSFHETTEEEGSVFSGYRISSNVLMNELLQTGLVVKTAERYALNLAALPRFVQRLQEIQSTLVKNDDRDLAQLVNQTASPATADFFAAYNAVQSENPSHNTGTWSR